MRHDLVSLLRLDSSMQVGHLVTCVRCNASHIFLDIVASTFQLKHLDILMLFRTILFNFIVFIDCGLQIPGYLSKRLFSAYHLYQHDCKNKQKNVVSAKKSYLYL